MKNRLRRSIVINSLLAFVISRKSCASNRISLKVSNLVSPLLRRVSLFTYSIWFIHKNPHHQRKDDAPRSAVLLVLVAFLCAAVVPFDKQNAARGVQRSKITPGNCSKYAYVNLLITRRTKQISKNFTKHFLLLVFWATRWRQQFSDYEYATRVINENVSKKR